MPRVNVDLRREWTRDAATTGQDNERDPALNDTAFKTLDRLYPLLVALLAIFAIAPLTFPGSLQTHTGLNAIYNLIDLHTHLAPTWAPTFGRAFDLLRGEGALGYAFAEFFHLLGATPLDSIKIIYALAFLFSGWGMFALARQIFASDAAGLLAAIVYVYFPYHLATVYVRGAFGEAVAWALFPFALLALIQFHSRATLRQRDYVPTIFAFALLFATQPGLAILFAMFALPFVFAVDRARFGGTTIFATLSGLALGALATLPAFLQNNSALDANGFTPAFVYPFQFLTASWGTALPKGNYLEQFPYQIGIAALGLSLLALALLYRERVDVTAHARRITRVAIAASAILLLLMTPFFSALWEISRATLLVPYPFELLAFVGVALSLVAGAVPLSDARLRELPMLAALSAIPILAVYSYLAPEYIDFAPTRPAAATFNQNELALLDYKIVRPPGIFHHGATVELDLQWQALREVNHDYTVFVHAVDEDGKEWGSEDAKPQSGALPTLKWTPGRVISDTHSIQIDLAGPSEGYHLELGIYNAATGERALTETGADEIRIDSNP